MDGKFFAFTLALVAFATFATLPGAEAQSASSKRKSIVFKKKNYC